MPKRADSSKHTRAAKHSRQLSEQLMSGGCPTAVLMAPEFACCVQTRRRCCCPCCLLCAMHYRRFRRTNEGVAASPCRRDRTAASTQGQQNTAGNPPATVLMAPAVLAVYRRLDVVWGAVCDASPAFGSSEPRGCCRDMPKRPDSKQAAALTRAAEHSRQPAERVPSATLGVCALQPRRWVRATGRLFCLYTW